MPSSELPKDDEREIQDIVHELSQDIEKDRAKRKQIQRILVTTAVSIFSAGILILVSYLLYLNFSVTELETQVKAKDKSLKELEENLNSLMVQEQLREENYLTSGQDLDSTLASQVEDNLAFLKETTAGYKGKNILRGNEKYPEIALTFDLATGEELSTVLRLIEKYNIRITIFLSNERPSDTSGSFFVRTNLDLIRKIAKTGRAEFGNHTWSHFNYLRSITETSQKKRLVLDYLSKQVLELPRMAEEMKRVEDVFYHLTKSNIQKYYRLPYGALNQLILDAHAKFGYNNHIMWSNNSKGSLDLPDYISKPFVYRLVSKGKKEMVKNPHYKTSRETLEFLEAWEASDPHGMNGAIILMHLGGPRKFDKLITILPEFVETMKGKGYRFVTVSEVMNDSLED